MKCEKADETEDIIVGSGKKKKNLEFVTCKPTWREEFSPLGNNCVVGINVVVCGTKRPEQRAEENG